MSSTSTLSSTSVDKSHVRIANLRTLNFSKLVTRNDAELAALLSTCERDGFFYLDLRDWKSGDMIKDLDTTDTIVKKWFSQPVEQKEKTETLSDAHGYKPTGQQSGVLENSRDGYESLRISRTATLARSPLPEVVCDNIDLFENFQFSNHHVLKTILGCLSDLSGLEGPDRFEHHHQNDHQSRSALYFLHHPPRESNGKIGHNMHTDAGTLTLLFTKQWGLQVLTPADKEWEYVVPKPGHAIINVGDTLRCISNQRLRSAMHRVLPVGGKMIEDRYSTAYFLRAGDDAIFRGTDGKDVTAEQWFLRKFYSFTQPLEEQRKDSITFGGMDKALGTVV